MDNDSPRPRLAVAALRDELAGTDLPWRRLDVVDEVGSTNAELLARAGAGEDIDGAVLLAEAQTAGRGRHGREWSTPPRSQLALSVGVDAEAIPNSRWGWLTLATGVAVVDALAGLSGVEAGLKWPNDVMVGEGKLAGILAEVAVPKPVIVIGLGLNVTMTPAEAPDPVATSLAMLDAPVTDRTVLAGKILHHLAARIAAWRAAAGSDEVLASDYRRYSQTLGTSVCAKLPGGRQIEGVAEAIDELGRLRIDTNVGPETVAAGDVAHVRPSI